ncbi:MAG: hypothetical protein ACUZ8H_12530 [Candidatus Anammoxibacter sp.]
MGSFANQLSKLTQTNEQKLDVIRQTVDEKIKHMQDSNEKNLALIRATVDEKLSATLEKRLGESFKSVSERLKQVLTKGLILQLNCPVEVRTITIRFGCR